jgi:hypothetical protein
VRERRRTHLLGSEGHLFCTSVLLPTDSAHTSGYSLYLIYWYKSTNTDAARTHATADIPTAARAAGEEEEEALRPGVAPRGGLHRVFAGEEGEAQLLLRASARGPAPARSEREMNSERARQREKEGGSLVTIGSISLATDREKKSIFTVMHTRESARARETEEVTGSAREVAGSASAEREASLSLHATPFSLSANSSLSSPASLSVPHHRCSVYLLYWYKSTNTDAAHLSVAPPRRSNARSAARQTFRASGMARERVKKKQKEEKVK